MDVARYANMSRNFFSRIFDAKNISRVVFTFACRDAGTSEDFAKLLPAIEGVLFTCDDEN